MNLQVSYPWPSVTSCFEQEMAIVNLNRKLDDPASPTTALVLGFEARAKSRLRAVLEDGRDAAVVLPRGTQLKPGDLLSGDDGSVVLVKAAKEKVSLASTDDPHLLARACYHLGNRHIALQIRAEELRYLHDHVLDDMVRQLGLTVVATDATFEPESGAYGDHAHIPAGGHGHHH